MLTIILGIIAIVGIAFLINWLSQETYGDDWVVWVTITLVVAGVTIFVVMLLVSLGAVISTVYRETKNEIVSIKDNSQISGQFFLGSGTINEKPVYWYYEETAQGMQLKYSGTEISFIKEMESNKGYKITKYIKDNTPWTFGIERIDNYTFEVPQGTIIKQFKLDSE